MTKKEISKGQLTEFCESSVFESIIQKNHEKYKKRWLKWTNKKDKIKFGGILSWNWAGFLLGEFWLLYRKMYALAFIYIFIRALLVVLPEFFPQLHNLMSVLTLSLNLTLGMHSYGWYLAKTYTIYEKNKNNDLRQSKDDTLFFAEQGGTSLKSPLIYLAVLMVLIALGVMYIINNSSSTSAAHANTTPSSVYSEKIEFVRSGIFNIDESIYLANALEGYPLFTDYTWEERVSSQGRQIVGFIAKYDVLKEVPTDMVDFNSERVSQIAIAFDFAMNLNDDSFDLYSVQIFVDGTPVLTRGSATQEYAFKLLQKIYKSQRLGLYAALYVALGVQIVHDLPTTNK